MKVNITIPKSWEVLKNWQKIELANLLMSQCSKNKILRHYKILKILLCVKNFQFWNYWKLKILLQNLTLKDCEKYYDWIFNNIGSTVFLGKLKGKTITYLSPTKRFLDLTIYQFACAEDLLLVFLREKKIETIAYIAACLYLPKKKNSLSKFEKLYIETFGADILKYNAKKLPCILLSYLACRQHLQKLYPEIFSSMGGNMTLPTSSGFGRLVLHFSGGKFGILKETRGVNIYDFLDELKEKIKATK